MVKWENLQSYPDLFRFVRLCIYFAIGWTQTSIQGIWCAVLLIDSNEECIRCQDEIDASDEETVEVKEVK